MTVKFGSRIKKLIDELGYTEQYFKENYVSTTCKIIEDMQRYRTTEFVCRYKRNEVINVLLLNETVVGEGRICSLL
jgi:hypothetical protein